jgi:hypothetical protein
MKTSIIDGGVPGKWAYNTGDICQCLVDDLIIFLAGTISVDIIRNNTYSRFIRCDFGGVLGLRQSKRKGLMMIVSMRSKTSEAWREEWVRFVKYINGSDVGSSNESIDLEANVGDSAKIFGATFQIPAELFQETEWRCWFQEGTTGYTVFAINDTPLAVSISGGVAPLPVSLKDVACIALSYVDTSKISETLAIVNPESLTTLHILFCEYPTVFELLPLMRFNNLKYLCIEESRLLDEPKPVTDLSPLIGLKQLKDLSLTGSICQKLKTIEPLTQLPDLRALTLFDCPEGLDLMPLAQIPRLDELTLSGCITSSNLSIISSLTHLDCLSLNVDESFKDLTPLAQLKDLRSLLISGCSEVADIGPLAALLKLEELHLFWCPSLTNLAPLAELPNLASLLLFKCTACDVTPLTRLTHLRKLVLSGCGPVKGVNLLSGMKNLKELHIVD